MSRFDQYAQLASLLHDMEKDLGLNELTKAEKSILSAMKKLDSFSDSDSFIASHDIQKHRLCADIPLPSFFRGIASLLKKELILLPDGRSKGLYRLSRSFDDQ